MPRGIPRNKSTDQNISHRLKIARGHLDKVLKMVEDKEYCIDIVHQSLAVQAALRKVDHIILRHHLESCVSDSIKKGQGEESIEEIINVLEKSK
jgi:DNA-binding FrmR family transcriptional regulator